MKAKLLVNGQKLGPNVQRTRPVTIMYQYVIILIS